MHLNIINQFALGRPKKKEKDTSEIMTSYFKKNVLKL